MGVGDGGGADRLLDAGDGDAHHGRGHPEHAHQPLRGQHPGRAAAGGTDWFTFMSLFPPTYDDQANGFRIDLMQKLAALHPGYLRIPGGNYLEGDTIDTRFNWQTTVGPLTDRPGHFNSAWGYWSQDGMGLLEFLELAEELHAQPVLAVWAGYTLNGTVVAQDQLAPYVQVRRRRAPVRERSDDELLGPPAGARRSSGAVRRADGRDRQRGLLRLERQLQRLPLPDVLRRSPRRGPLAEVHRDRAGDEPARLRASTTTTTTAIRRTSRRTPTCSTR